MKRSSSDGWRRRSAVKAARKRAAGRDPERYAQARAARQSYAEGRCEADGMHAANCPGWGSQAHHVHPTQHGGAVYDVDNLRWVAADCHARIHSRPAEATAAGLLIR